MAKYEKKRSARRSTPRHPITMASTAEPPDPMSCELTVILLPESRAHGCHMQKGLFPGTYCVHAGTCVFGPFLHAGCAGAVWVRGGSLGRGMDAGRRCLTPRVGDVRWSGPPCRCAGTCGRCTGGRVGSWATWCLPQCGVEYAWALGLLRRLVALSGLFLWWPSRAFSCCCVGERYRKCS